MTRAEPLGSMLLDRLSNDGGSTGNKVSVHDGVWWCYCTVGNTKLLVRI